MVEITTRTHRGQLLLRPCADLNQRILAILGRALSKYQVELHAFVFLSNHWHALATVANSDQLSRFMGYVNGNVAKAVQRANDWEGTVWARRGTVIPVEGDEAAEDRLRYILAHGAKEGLVASPLDWPGVSSARALALGEKLVGVWRNSYVATRLRRRGTSTPSDAPLEHYPIHLTPLPAWSGLSDEERRARASAAISEITRKARQDHPSPLGIAAVCAQDPRSTPIEEHVARRAPIVHTACAALRAAFVAARTAFLRAYYTAVAASEPLIAAVSAVFPPGAFPPRPPAAPKPSPYPRPPPTTLAFDITPGTG